MSRRHSSGRAADADARRADGQRVTPAGPAPAATTPAAPASANTANPPGTADSGAAATAAVAPATLTTAAAAGVTAGAGAGPGGGRDFATAATAGLPERAFPITEHPEPRVQIAAGVYEAIVAHSRESTAVELCGILVGTVARDQLGPHLLIDSHIRGVGTRNEGAQVTFTHDTWDHIHREMERHHAGKRIVGWYHTHPGFGIFLSEYDKFIHDNFFDQPFQVAMVVDPVSGRDGVFAWCAGQIKALSRCWIGEQERQLAQGPVGKDEMSALHATPGATPPGARTGTGSGPVPTDGPGATRLAADRDELMTLDWWQLGALVVAFALGGLLAHWYSGAQLRAAYREMARTELRELLTATAATAATRNELRVIDERAGEVESAVGSLAVLVETARRTVATAAAELGVAAGAAHRPAPAEVTPPPANAPPPASAEMPTAVATQSLAEPSPPTEPLPVPANPPAPDPASAPASTATPEPTTGSPFPPPGADRHDVGSASLPPWNAAGAACRGAPGWRAGPGEAARNASFAPGNGADPRPSGPPGNSGAFSPMLAAAPASGAHPPTAATAIRPDPALDAALGALAVAVEAAGELRRRLAEDRRFLADLAAVAEQREQRLQTALSGRANDPATVDERIREINTDLAMVKQRQAITYLFFAQLVAPPSRGGQPTDPRQLTQVRHLMDLAVSADPKLEAEFRALWPELFPR